MMKIVDVHTHAFPDFLAQKAIEKLSQNAYAVPYHNGTINGLLESMDKAGVYQSWVQSIATKPEQEENILKWSIEIKSDRIIPFISVHPESNIYIEILKKAKDNGIKGVKLHPHYQDFFINDTKLYKFYEDILKEDFIILFHSGKDDGFKGYDNASAKRVSDMIKRFEGEKIILAHYGAYKEWNEVLDLIAGKDVYLETSFAINIGGKEIFKKILDKHNIDKILFGTDSPWNDVKKEIELLKNIELRKVILEKIFYKNSEKLLSKN